MSSNVLNPRKPLLWLIGAAVAATFFASGALVASATIDGDDDDSSNQTQLVVPGIGRDGGAAEPAGLSTQYPGSNDSIAKGAPGQRGGSDASFAGCRAPLPAGVVTATGLDFGKASFAPALPNAGFSALSIALSAQGECDANGAAVSGALTLDSAWKHDETGLEAYVSQRASTEKVASVIRQDSATFWANGYVFHVGVNGYHILPADVAPDQPVTTPMPADLPSTSNSSSGSGSAEPGRSIAPAPQPDPRAAEVLRQLIGQLAPNLDQKCFWTTGSGDWNDLSELGIGDPRPAIPAGFALLDMNSTTFNPPAAGCDTTLQPTEGFNFNANWQKDPNGTDFAYLGLSIYSSGGPGNQFGQISEYGANWSSGKFAYSVYAKSNKPLGVETIRAIAKAMDPSFNEACFIRDRELEASELSGLGLREAKAPDGYKQLESNLRATEIGAGCTKPDGFAPSYNLNWVFEKGADVIAAGVNRYGGGSGDGSGFQGPNNLSWTDSQGTNYHVNAYSKGTNPEVSKDDLIAVAKSMDPSFDISKLTDGGDKPIPLPERSARP